MYRFIVFLILSSLLLTSCSDGVRSYFKRSANNKIIDSKGFVGGKHLPLYNKKYISMAKKNILEENFDDDYVEDDITSVLEDKEIDATTRNRLMYMQMVKGDKNKKTNANRDKHSRNPQDEYPSLSKLSDKLPTSPNNEEELRREITNIKKMLNEAKEEIAKNKCPYSKPKSTKDTSTDVKSQQTENDDESNSTLSAVDNSQDPQEDYGVSNSATNAI